MTSTGTRKIAAVTTSTGGGGDGRRRRFGVGCECGHGSARTEGVSFRQTLEPDHQQLVSAGTRLGLRLRRPEGWQAGARRDDGDREDQEDRRDPRGGGLGPPLPQRRPGRAHHRLVRPGQTRHGLVPGREDRGVEREGQGDQHRGLIPERTRWGQGRHLHAGQPSGRSERSNRSRSRVRRKITSGSSTWPRASAHRPSHPTTRC